MRVQSLKCPRCEYKAFNCRYLSSHLNSCVPLDAAKHMKKVIKKRAKINKGVHQNDDEIVSSSSNDEDDQGVHQNDDEIVSISSNDEDDEGVHQNDDEIVSSSSNDEDDEGVHQNDDEIVSTVLSPNNEENVGVGSEAEAEASDHLNEQGPLCLIKFSDVSSSDEEDDEEDGQNDGNESLHTEEDVQMTSSDVGRVRKKNFAATNFF